jgi:hypothetical protein
MEKSSRSIQSTHSPTWTGLRILRLVVFILHATSAIFISVVATRCGASFIADSYTETLNSEHHDGYLVVTEDGCNDPRNISCFYGIPIAYDIAQRGLEWNVFALIATFEWISASFALGHLSGNFDPNKRTGDDVSQIKLVCLIWNLAGGLWLMPYTTPMSLMQAGITVLALIISTSVQYYPMGSEDDSGVVMHYTEYCTSASLLFVGVLILYIPHPQSWAVIIGFTGILLCNLTGVAAHICKIDSKEGRVSLPFYDLDWGKIGNHFKLYMIHAWLGMLMSVLIVVYLARDSFSNGDIPWWVRFILINLLVTYTLFGVWATACYVIADIISKKSTNNRLIVIENHGEVVCGNTSTHPDAHGEDGHLDVDPAFKLWVCDRLGYGLTMLSAAAKLPIAFTVFYGLLGAPGDKICSVF